MMRRGPLADTPIRSLLEAAAEERTSGVIELHSAVEAVVYLVEGEIYLADLVGEAPLHQQLLDAGLLSRDQIARHTEPGDDGPYLALALDTDVSIDEHAIGDWLLDLTASTLQRVVGHTEGEYELDPYGSHPAGILASWSPAEVFDRVDELTREAEARAEQVREEAERFEAEARQEAERLEAEALATAEARDGAETSVAGSGDSAVESAVDSGGDASADLAGGNGREAQDVGSADPTVGEVGDEGGAESGAGAQGDEAPEMVPIALPPPPDAHHPAPTRSAGAGVLVVASDEVPDGMDRVELTPVEWRVVVLASQGMSLGELADRLRLEEAVIDEAVAALCERGLLATVG